MSRWWVWVSYSGGVLIAYFAHYRGALSAQALYCALNGSALALAMHWASNRRWLR